MTATACKHLRDDKGRCLKCGFLSARPLLARIGSGFWEHVLGLVTDPHAKARDLEMAICVLAQWSIALAATKEATSGMDAITAIQAAGVATALLRDAVDLRAKLATGGCPCGVSAALIDQLREAASYQVRHARQSADAWCARLGVS